ncbi:hypothetical protein MOTC310_17575 [Methylobacterium oryzae]|uniref:PRC-barrel domain-containing protein n=2 Tax=Methylobacteriaceae TaxID=119045 RepID=A0ABU7TQW8_9HYPH
MPTAAGGRPSRQRRGTLSEAGRGGQKAVSAASSLQHPDAAARKRCRPRRSGAGWPTTATTGAQTACRSRPWTPRTRRSSAGDGEIGPSTGTRSRKQDSSRRTDRSPGVCRAMIDPKTIGVDARSGDATASNLIASDKVEGTAVHLSGASSIGRIERLMIDKPSGRIVYAIVRMTSSPDQAASDRAIPWKVLAYSVDERAYVIDSTDERIRSGPVYTATTADPTFDPAWEEHVHSYFNTEPYWNTEVDRATDVPFGKKKI